MNVTKDTWVAKEAGSTGVIHFDGGTLSTGGLSCAVNDLTGTGTINTRGIASDVDLIFNSIYGTNQILTLNDSERYIMVYLNLDGSSFLGAGYGGTGTVSIYDGSVIQSNGGYIGYQSGSSGTVTVDSAGSTWTNNSDLTVGYYGNGTLAITSGGTASSSNSYIGRAYDSTGHVSVDGIGSTWTNSDDLYVGREGIGTLAITGGGTGQQ